jgi:hypothetical protein
MPKLLPSWNPTSRLVSRDTLPTLPRTECMPPTLVTPPVVGSWWQRLLHWLMSPGVGTLPGSAPPPNRLQGVKREFGALLADLDNSGAEQLRWRIQHAHSLRELWHLRSEVYNALALAHSQAEAATRLALVDTHFPVRAAQRSTISQFSVL